MVRFGLTLAACLLTGLPSFASSVPVFRYALEQRQPGRYELIVYHRGPLSPADGAALRELTGTARNTNVRVTVADLDLRTDPDLLQIWERDGKGVALPRLVLRFPGSKPEVPSVWSGPLTGDALPFDSPARRAVFDHLTNGNAAVVVLLLSGDGPADAAARTWLRAELPRIAARIQLPEPTADGPQVQSELPMRLEFPVVELPRTGEESLFVRVLLGSDDGLEHVKGPIAFPVFGRGRVLCSLHDNDLNDTAKLRRSLEFLCGPFSFEVKEQNPGMDLLVAGNWDRIFDVQRGPAPRVVTADGLPIAKTRPTARILAAPAQFRSAPPAGYAAGEMEPGDHSSARRPWLRIGTVAAAGLVLLMLLWALRGRRPPASH